MAASDGPFPQERLQLPQITLCAVTSVNVEATVRALEKCLGQIEFASCKLFTDASIMPSCADIQVVPIKRLNSSEAYSTFLLSELTSHIFTSHCLVVQWDGHVLDARRWRPEFLDYDYIGATWPQFNDGYDVGNGGFSLRSRRLMELCRDPEFRPYPAEDIAICRVNRGWLEGKGMRFASSGLANLWATERAGDLKASFGYHGVFNMPQAIGVDEFWEVYRELDHPGTIWRDFARILREVGGAADGRRRVTRMLIDRLYHASKNLRSRLFKVGHQVRKG